MIRQMTEFLSTLDELPRGIETRMLRAALRKGANVFRQEIRQNIDNLNISEDAKKRLKQAITIRNIKRRGQTRLGIFLERHEDEEGKSAWWAHTIEHGTAERAHKTGHITGMIQPQPFIAPAIDAAMATAQKAIDDELEAQMLKEIARLERLGKW